MKTTSTLLTKSQSDDPLTKPRAAPPLEATHLPFTTHHLPSLQMILKIAHSLSISENQVRKTIALLDEGATIPFISRYRKEATGSLDEVQVAAIRDLRDQYVELEKRREAILKSLQELEKLTPELEKAVRGAETLAKLEDIYLPYKPKRKTRAMAAREKGLQ